MGRRKDEGHFGLVALSVVAEELGSNLKTVQSDYRRAIAKIRKQPRPLVLEWIHAVAVHSDEPLKAGSAECLPIFRELYGQSPKVRVKARIK